MPDREQFTAIAEPASRAGADAAAAINQRIFETSLDLILVVDRKGTFIRVSPSSRAILGYDPQEMVGRSAVEFLYPEDLEHTRNEMRMARRGREVRNFECRYRHKDGRVVTLAWTGVWSEPEQQHFFIGRDMSERIRLEAQLRQAHKLEAIGRLTGGVAHDFNNILTVITGAAEELTQAAASEPKLVALARTIDQAAERGAQLTQRMLAFARQQSLQARSFDLNESVTRTAVLLQRTLGEDVDLRLELEPALWPAFADMPQVEDALLNLAINARDAMPGGGLLVIETANAHLDEEYAKQNPEVTPGDYVALVVTDSGTGMPPEVIERVFEPFFTTKDIGRGTGLGLSMVYGFMKQSRGHIKIYSELGRGTSVRLYLPRAQQDAATLTDAPPLAPERTSGQETVLVVEDDAAVRAIAVNILTGLGYRVLQALDGKSALEVLRGGEKVDLLFTDLVMPHGLDGQELARLARELRPTLKLLFTSGYSDPFLKGRGGTIGPLVGKPYRRQTLASAVRKALDAADSS